MLLAARHRAGIKWDAMIAEIEELGIDELTAIKQAAYDRYMAR